MEAAAIFTPEVLRKIEESIRTAESQTSGEIRLHVEDVCHVDPVERAIELFEDLKMHETKERNGVLFYIAVASRKFAVIGDQRIHNNVGEKYWKEILDEVNDYLKQGNIADGLAAGIVHVGKELSQYFPLQANDKNELSNEITFGR